MLKTRLKDNKRCVECKTQSKLIIDENVCHTLSLMRHFDIVHAHVTDPTLAKRPRTRHETAQRSHLYIYIV